MIFNLDDFKLIDTPGLLDEGNIIDYIEVSRLKRIIPNNEIKPNTTVNVDYINNELKVS